jgi:hypothetical protein
MGGSDLLPVNGVGEVTCLDDVEVVSRLTLLDDDSPSLELLHLHEVDEVFNLRSGEGGKHKIRFQRLPDGRLHNGRLGEAGSLKRSAHVGSLSENIVMPALGLHGNLNLLLCDDRSSVLWGVRESG